MSDNNNKKTARQRWPCEKGGESQNQLHFPISNEWAGIMTNGKREDMHNGGKKREEEWQGKWIGARRWQRN